MIPALIALGTGIYQYAESQKQKRMAKNLKPSNYVPPAVQEAINTKRLQSSSMSPGYLRGVEKIGQATAGTIETAKRIGGSPGQLQQAAADADARQKEALKDLQVADNAYKANSNQQLSSLLLTEGQYQSKSMDDYNATKSALIGASNQNKYNALTTLGEGIISSLPDSYFGPKAKNSFGVNTNAGRRRLRLNPGMESKSLMGGGGGGLSGNDFLRNIDLGFTPGFNY